MQFLKSYIFLASALLLISCGNSRNGVNSSIVASDIINGENVSATNEIAKSIVLLKDDLDEQETETCTGTILSNEIILTAAHCVEFLYKPLYIVFKVNGKNVKKRDIRLVDVEGVIRHPDYGHRRPEGEADIALVRFHGGLPAGYKPIKLVNENFSLKRGDEVIISGYGMDNGKEGTGRGILRQAKTTVLGRRTLTEVTLDGKNSSVCFGDSGGPAFVKIGGQHVQWGLARSVSTAYCNLTSTHTEVMKYLTWIRMTKAQL